MTKNHQVAFRVIYLIPRQRYQDDEKVPPYQDEASYCFPCGIPHYAEQGVASTLSLIEHFQKVVCTLGSV